MYPLFQDILQMESFIDDIGIFTNTTFDQDLTIFHQVLLRMEESGFTVNPLKCAWDVQSTDYLGFRLTTDDIKPLPKKKLKQLVELHALWRLHTYGPSLAKSITTKTFGLAEPIYLLP